MAVRWHTFGSRRLRGRCSFFLCYSHSCRFWSATPMPPSRWSVPTRSRRCWLRSCCCLKGTSLEVCKHRTLQVPGFSIERHFRSFGGTNISLRGCNQYAVPAVGGLHATFSARTLANRHHRLRDD